MSKHEKTLKKLTEKPTPSDLKWDELKGALEHLGYQMKSSTGSRRKFVHKTSGHVISLHEPHPQPDVKQYVIRQVVDHLKAQGAI